MKRLIIPFVLAVAACGADGLPQAPDGGNTVVLSGRAGVTN